MTLGQEFGAFAATLAEDEQRLAEARLLLHELNLGGTAIGTGLNSRPGYRERAVEHLRRLTGIPTLVSSPDLIEATQDVGVFVQLSGVLKRTAVKLSKICNDLRLLSSGPQAGFGDIALPARQAGSSIMPGKVNPVIPEAVNQIAFEIIGNDVTITLAAEGGQLQLNAFEPVIYRSLSAGLDHLTAGSESSPNTACGASPPTGAGSRGPSPPPRDWSPPSPPRSATRPPAPSRWRRTTPAGPHST